MDQFSDKRCQPYKDVFKKTNEEQLKKEFRASRSKMHNVKRRSESDFGRIEIAADGTKLFLFDSQYCPFSNSYSKALFKIDGILYNSVQQWIDAYKALLFGDDEDLKIIVNCRSSKLENFVAQKFNVDEYWSEALYALTKKGIEEKVKQNEDVRKELKATGDCVIAEAQVYNPFWTTGVDIDDAHVLDYSKWPGNNMLGKLLMKIRDEL